MPNFLSLSSLLHKEEPRTASVAHLTFHDESGNLPRLFMLSILLAAPKGVASSVPAARATTVTVTKWNAAFPSVLLFLENSSMWSPHQEGHWMVIWKMQTESTCWITRISTALFAWQDWAVSEQRVNWCLACMLETGRERKAWDISNLIFHALAKPGWDTFQKDEGSIIVCRCVQLLKNNRGLEREGRQLL